MFSQVIWVFLPSLIIGVIFFLAIRAIFNADKSERKAQAKAEAEVRQRLLGGSSKGSAE